MSPDPPLPEPVFGGFTETASLAAFGVEVGGTGVFVFGTSVLVGVAVAVGVCVFSFRNGVGDGVSVQSGSRCDAIAKSGAELIWPRLSGTCDPVARGLGRARVYDARRGVRHTQHEDARGNGRGANQHPFTRSHCVSS